MTNAKDLLSWYDAAMTESNPMTNDQQAYDRAMAHNALLREALAEPHLCADSSTGCPVCEALNATDASVEAWKARQNNGAYQRGYAEAERLGNIEIERLKQALQNVIKNDKTYYNHHDPRPDGRLPKEDGGTIWLTPKEIAKRALPQPPKEGN